MTLKLIDVLLLSINKYLLKPLWDYFKLKGFVTLLIGILTLWVVALGLEHTTRASIYMSNPISINPLTVYFENNGKITTNVFIEIVAIKVKETLPDNLECHYFSESIKISPQLPIMWNFFDEDKMFIFPKPDSISLYALKIKWTYDSFLPDFIPYISKGCDSLWNIYNNDMNRWEWASLKSQPLLKIVINTLEKKHK